MMRQPDLGVGADVASDGLDGIRFSRGMVVGLLLRDRGEIRWRGGRIPRCVRRRRRHGGRVGHDDLVIVFLEFVSIK